MKGFAFGQYYPASSVLHRMDPRAKVICAVAYIVASFLCKNTFSFALLILSTIALILISRIPMKVVLRSVRALIFIMAFTAVLNIFWIVDETPGAAPLVDFYFITIYAKGIYHAVFILVRILAMVIGTGLFLTYTTTPIALTDALESLLRPLAAIKVPVHAFSMMMTIALRFIPTIMEETDKIMSAQKARGADFTTGSLAKRAKALIPPWNWHNKNTLCLSDQTDCFSYLTSSKFHKPIIKLKKQTHISLDQYVVCLICL